MFKRALTVFVGVPAVVFLIRTGSEPVFFLFVLVLSGLALHEFFKLAVPDENVWARGFGMVLGSCVLLGIFLRSYVYGEHTDPVSSYTMGLYVFSCLALFFYHIIFDYQSKNLFNHIAIKAFGIFYVPVLFSYVVLIRAGTDGVGFLFFLICVTWAGDTGAYLLGTWIGRHALCMRISPKKTVEGSLGGIIAAVGTAFVCRALFLERLDVLHCLVLGAGINVFNQFGDLGESLIKRAAGAKDSGCIIPGHGGVLDRIDSLLFAAPFLYYYSAILLVQP